MFKKIILISVFLFALQVVFSQNIPDVSLKNLDGKSVSLKKISKNKTVMISFWAVWCGPCINELDAIAEEYEDLQEDTNFELIAVSIDDSRTKSRVKPLVNGKDWEFTVLLDSNQEFKRSMNVTDVPHVIIVKNGVVKYTHTNYTPGGEDALIEKFKEIQNN